MLFNKSKYKPEKEFMEEVNLPTVELECKRKIDRILDMDLLPCSAIDDYRSAIKVLAMEEERRLYNKWFDKNIDGIKILFDKMKIFFLKENGVKMVLEIKDDNVVVDDKVMLQADATARLLRNYGYAPIISDDRKRFYIN